MFFVSLWLRRSLALCPLCLCGSSAALRWIGVTCEQTWCPWCLGGECELIGRSVTIHGWNIEPIFDPNRGGTLSSQFVHVTVRCW